MRIVLVSIFFIALWLLLSGVYKSLTMFFGLCSVILVMTVLHRMNQKDGNRLVLNFKLLKSANYIVFLAAEVVKANYAVSKLLLSKQLKLNQKFLKIPFSQSSEVSQVVFANSITLTPGTVTIEIEPRNFIVHALNCDSNTEKDLDLMDRKVSEIEN